METLSDRLKRRSLLLARLNEIEEGQCAEGGVRR